MKRFICIGRNKLRMDKKIKSVYLLSLGCSKNLVDAECMSELIRIDNHIIVDSPEMADVIIVNTCGFIESAKTEAIEAILDMSDYKKPVGNADYLIVTGCLSQRYAADILNDLPEVDAVLGTADYGRITEIIDKLYTSDDRCLDLPGNAGSIEHLSVKRKPSSGQKYAYIKVAEGCSNRCSYCAIPGIRGDFQSRPIDDIIDEAKYLSESGFDELILIAQDTTRYGLDLYGRRALTELLQEICHLPLVRMIRILYVYADGITDELIELMKKEPKIARYLDLPIQHASDKILKKMNRHDDLARIINTVQSLRAAMPDIVLRSTVMVGFPGEIAEDFEILLAALKELRFDRLGCFVFSAEEGTPAYDWRPRVRKNVAQARLARVMEQQQRISLEKNIERIGTMIPVTLETIHEDGIFYIGRSYGEAPEVDPVILVAAGREDITVGQTCLVRILDAGEYELTGETVE